jgi:signal transduction histidine kinase
MIKAITITTLSLFYCGALLSQVGGTDQLRDSLKHELVTAKNDTSKVLLMAQLSSAYNGFYPDTVNYYGNEALKLAERINYSRGKAMALIALGLGIQLEGEYPKSFDYLYQCLQITEKKHFVLETAICYSSIGNTYWFVGDYSKSVEFCKKADNLFKGVINAKGVREWMLFNNLVIGQSYLEYQLDSSYAYLLRYYDATKQDKFWHPVALYNLSDCLFRRGDHKTSFYYAREGIAGAIANGDNLTEAEACAAISGFFKKIQKSDSVIYYANKGLRAANSISYGLGIYKNSKLLADEYEQVNIKEALHYHKLYDSINESMYGVKKVQELQKTLAEEQYRQQQIQKEQLEKENQRKQYGFIAGLAIMFSIAFILYRNNLQKRKANNLLQFQKEKIESTLAELKTTQAQLIQSEKLASLGELTAGIAHEIQNPLNFVNNFSEVSHELIDEMKEEIKQGNFKEVNLIADDVKQNLAKINHHGQRASSIVKGMLEHSRTSSGEKTLTDINALCEEYLRLAYQSMRSKDKSFQCETRLHIDPSLPIINVVGPDISRVILNLLNNAFQACNEKSGSLKIESNGNYTPFVTITTKNYSNRIEIIIKDNGNGIPDSIKDKIFQPFFTTKPTGQGTGLGLSLTYDIVKAHGGEIKVNSSENEGTEFTIQLPIS